VYVDKSLGEGAREKKARPAKQGSIDSSGSSGDEKKDVSLDDTTSSDATKKKEVSSV